MGDEWENGDVPSVIQSSAFGLTAVVRMLQLSFVCTILLTLHISDTWWHHWHR